MDHNTVFAWFFDFGDDNGSLFAVRFVEVGELFEGVVADDVRIEDEERGGVLAEGFGGKFKGTGGAERFGFDGKLDADVVFFFVLKVCGVSKDINCWGFFCKYVEKKLGTFFRAADMTSGR